MIYQFSLNLIERGRISSFAGISGKKSLVIFDSINGQRTESEDKISYSSSTNIQIFTPNTP